MRTMLSQASGYLAQHRARRTWLKVLFALACAVVFCTTYALILPAVTMEHPMCGLEEHTHTAACYTLVPTPFGDGSGDEAAAPEAAAPEAAAAQTRLACSYESLGVHRHTADCYDADGNLVCGYADYVVHTHTPECYDENGNLVCALPQVEAHTHTADCYTTVTTEGHVHTADCYTLERGELICGLEEGAGAHTHTPECYDADGNLVCGLEESAGHVHTDECYAWNEVLTCTQSTDPVTTTVLTCDKPEIILHTHTPECYDADGNLVCGMLEVREHVHDASCYQTVEAADAGAATEGAVAPNGLTAADIEGLTADQIDLETIAALEPLTCGLEEGPDHTHTVMCYGTWELTCGQQEHTHTEACYGDGAAALPDGAQVPEGYTQQYTYQDEADGFSVTVYAPEGAVPEGATLVAARLDEGSDAYAAAERALAAGTQDDGFAALDIHFEDADGNEVEPAGDVYVAIDAPGVLPDAADPATVTVQHLVEDEAGQVASVDTVADSAGASAGVIAAEGSDVQAAFEVSGFSTFAIWWGGNGQAEAASTASNDQVKVYVYVAATGLSDDCLDLLGIDPNTLDKNGYFPAGEIYLDSSYFNGKDSHAVNTSGEPLITSEDDWDKLVAALGQMDTSNLANKTDRSVWRQNYDRIDYTGNQGNHVGDYLSQARGDVGYTWGSQHTALFRWHDNPYSAANVHCGFVDQNVNYHLDLFFTTNEIEFIYGNNGINSGNASNGRDGTTADTRTYITGSEIQEPDGITIPNGWYFEGYYADADFNTPWDGFGDPLNEDTTVYIKLTKNQVMTLSVQKEIAFAEGTESTEVSNKSYSFTISTTDSSVAGQSYTTSTGTASTGTGITFSTDPDEAGNYTATVTLTASTQNGVDGTVLVYGLPANNSSGQQISYTVTEDTVGADIDGYTLSSVTYNGGTGTDKNTVTATGQSSTASSTVMATNTYAKPSTGTLTIVKNIYGLNREQVAGLISGEYRTDGGLKFDVDYFNSVEGATTDDYENKNVFKGDWTFSAAQTLEQNSGGFTNSGTWNGDIRNGDEDITANETNGKEHYGSSSLHEMNNIDGTVWYQYTVTISDVNLDDWYHVWETHVDVAGYDMSSSVAAAHDDGSALTVYATDHANRSTAFQLTGDTTVTFTNTYTPNSFTVTKVDNTDSNITLPGAEFYLKNADGKYYSLGEDETVSWVGSTDGAKLFISDEKGQFTIKALPDGTYSLVETKAPDGYKLSSSGFTFVVSDGKVTRAGDTVFKSDSQTTSFNVTNSSGVELPHTGGPGTALLYTLGGLLIVAGAVMCGLMARRNRGRREGE